MTTLHHVTAGAGTPVLALHGWTLDHRVLHGVLEPVFATRPGFRRIYPDLPGMGRSPAPPSITSSADILAAVHAFVDETIGDEPFLLVGESYGGYLGRAIVRDRPAQVRGLAMICPVGVAVRHADRILPEPVVLRPDPELLAGIDDPALAAEFASTAVVQTPETLRLFREQVWSGLRLADPEAIARIIPHYALPEPPETGPPFTRPTLVLTGRQDAIVGYADQFALLEHYPRATFAALDLAGHNLQIEQPVLFEALIADWLERTA